MREGGTLLRNSAKAKKARCRHTYPATVQGGSIPARLRHIIHFPDAGHTALQWRIRQLEFRGDFSKIRVRELRHGTSNARRACLADEFVSHGCHPTESKFWRAVRWCVARCNFLKVRLPVPRRFSVCCTMYSPHPRITHVISSPSRINSVARISLSAAPSLPPTPVSFLAAVFEPPVSAIDLPARHLIAFGLTRGSSTNLSPIQINVLRVCSQK